MRLVFRGFLVAAAIVVAISPAAAEWHEATSKHFVIYADMKPERLREFAERLERFDKAVRVVRQMDDPEITPSNRLTVYTLPSQDAVGKLAGSSSVAGLYSARASGSVAFVPRSAGSTYDKFDLDGQTVFFHEYAHHIQLQNAGIALPRWVTEGFAEFFSTTKIESDGAAFVGMPADHRSYGLQSRAGLKLEDMLGGELKRLDAEASESLYARGWLLTHYLAFAENRKGQLTKYVHALQQGMPALQAATSAFGDLKKLNSELERYKTSRIPALRVEPHVLSIAPVTIRKMSGGEAAIVNVRIRSKFGVNTKTAPPLAAEARKIAAQYPKDPFVQAALAEAEYDAGQHVAAGAAADRALSVNPEDVHALIYKGRAEMELAKANPSKANWAAVRKWIQRANSLDKENAEPLVLFYQTYLQAGVQPTPNAVDAILYAVELVPQDGGLRMAAVRQLLQDNRIEDAKRLFGPLAFDPHAGEEWRRLASQVMAAIDKDDAKGALAALDAPTTEPKS